VGEDCKGTFGEPLSWHMEHMTLKMGEPVNIKLSVEEAVDPVED
jgi:hypothetical protein